MTRRGLLAILGAVLLPATALAGAPRYVEATAYCPCFVCCGENSPEVGGHGLTKSRVKPIEGVTLAADWNVFPRGMVLYLAGVGQREVQDTGTEILGNRVDVFFRRHVDALRFGRRRLRLVWGG